MHNNKAYSKSMSFFMVLLCVPLSGIGVDLYAPSLPYIAKDLAANPQLVQVSITIYMIAFGISQAIFGPISDTMGRKNVIICGAILYLFLSDHHGILFFHFYYSCNAFFSGRFCCTYKCSC